eukprot:UN22076
MQGGGWCYDQTPSNITDAGTLKECLDRSKGTRGSSRDWYSSNSYDGFLSTDKYRKSFYFIIGTLFIYPIVTEHPP